jgi:hypothetical protein
MMFIVNYGIVMPLTAALLFPVIAGIRSADVAVFAITAVVSGLIIAVHWGNIGKAMRHEHDTVRDFLKNKLFAKKAK